MNTGTEVDHQAHRALTCVEVVQWATRRRGLRAIQFWSEEQAWAKADADPALEVISRTVIKVYLPWEVESE